MTSPRKMDDTITDLSILAVQISSNIIRGRNTLDWSQSELARMSGVTSAAISLLEKGDRLPSLWSLLKICNAFSCSISELLQEHCFIDEKSTLYAKLNSFNKCTKDDQAMIIKLINRLAN